MLEGSCLCGEVAYAVQVPLLEAHHCHCGFCRKAHGTPFATYGVAPAAGLKWLRGEQAIARYESSPGFFRAFCPRCGAILPGAEAQGLRFLPLGNLDGDPGVRPEMHIFTASKAPWWEIEDGLVQHATFPPAFGNAPVQPSRPPQDPPGPVRGSCLCGRVAFVLEAAPRFARHCHCGRCRKGRAAGYASNAMASAAALRFTRGESERVTYRVPDARFFAQTFCGTCGGKLPRVDARRDIAVVPLGALDDAPGVLPREHIFVGSRAPWVENHDALPRYDAYPPEA